MSEIKIPRASSQRWSTLSTKEERDAFVRQYKSWKQNPFTKDLVLYLEAEYDKEIQSFDKEQSFLNLFVLRFKENLARAKRLVLSDLLRNI